MKKIIAFSFAAALLVAGCNPRSGGRTFGTDRYSVQQRENCERSTGKKCNYDLCQVTEGGVDPACDIGWQPQD